MRLKALRTLRQSASFLSISFYTENLIGINIKKRTEFNHPCMHPPHSNLKTEVKLMPCFYSLYRIHSNQMDSGSEICLNPICSMIALWNITYHSLPKERNFVIYKYKIYPLYSWSCSSVCFIQVIWVIRTDRAQNTALISIRKQWKTVILQIPYEKAMNSDGAHKWLF
jgi:hypothetical protein